MNQNFDGRDEGSKNESALSNGFEKFTPPGFDRGKEMIELDHGAKKRVDRDDTHVDGKKKVANFRSLFHYPKGAYFCLGNEFSERFSFYGMKAVLLIYLMNVHMLPGSTAKLIYHAFVCVAYFTPIFGSMIADGFLGRYRVILFGSIIYCIGHVLLTCGAIPSLGADILKVLDYAGLFVIALATGGIKPCVSSFGGDQFPPSMKAEQVQFFSFFYFMINVGSMLSIIITPILRRQPCMGSDTCYPLAFGVPAIFMFLATVIFCSGTKWYTKVPVTENVIARVVQCIFYAIKKKCRSKDVKKEHWLDYASPKFDKLFIDDVKALLDIMALFFPAILFWALFDQTGSTWLVQGQQMNGRLGQLTVLPDQMAVINPLLIIIMIPLFEGVVYPTLAKCNILTRLLRRMGLGGFLAAASFIMAGFLQLGINPTLVRVPSPGHINLTIANFLDCDVFVADGSGKNNFTVPSSGMVGNEVTSNVTLSNCPESQGNKISVSTPAKSDKAYFLALFNDHFNSTPLITYDWKKTVDGKTRVYFMFEPRVEANLSLTVEQGGTVKTTARYDTNSNQTTHADVEPYLIGSNQYDIYLKNCGGEKCNRKLLKQFAAVPGAAHVFVLLKNGTSLMQELIPANTVHLLWQVPQYIVLTTGEILFSISGLAFSYAQASPKMKSVFQAIWLLTVAFGNLIDMSLSGGGLFEGKQALEFFVYAGLMVVVMLIFIVLAWRYKDKSLHVKEEEKVLGLEKHQEE